MPAELLSIRASSIDVWRYYRSADDMSHREFMMRIRGDMPPTESMRYGTAFHNVLEQAVQFASENNRRKLTLRKSIRFGDGLAMVIPPSVEGELRTIGAQTEVTGERLYPDIGVRLTGTADALTPKRVLEYKTTGRLNLTRYLESFQWRAYLTLFARDRLTYCVFPLRRDRDWLSGTYELADYIEIDVFRYAGMEQELIVTLAEMAEYIRAAS